MNHETTNFENLSERTWQQSIDRLVDGELSDAQARELLALLDGIEGGWRRLALAYVEAQILGGDLAALMQRESVDADSDAATLSVSAISPPPTRHPRMALMALAIAASLLVGFVLSLWQRGGLSTAPATPATPLADSRPQPTGEQPQVPENVLARDCAKAQPVANGDASLAEVATKQAMAHEPGLVVLGSSGDSDTLDAAVPTRVIEALRRMGHRVDQRSGVMPVRLQDGRRIDVPYEQLEVQNPGGAAFQ